LLSRNIARKVHLHQPCINTCICISICINICINTTMKHARTPTDSARVWLTTILDLNRETKAIVALKQAFPGRPDVVARQTAHMEMRGRMGDLINELPKKHQAAVTKALVKAGLRE